MDSERFTVYNDNFALLLKEFIQYVKIAAQHPEWVLSAVPGSVYIISPDRPLVDGDVYYELARKTVHITDQGTRVDRYALDWDLDPE